MKKTIPPSPLPPRPATPRGLRLSFVAACLSLPLLAASCQALRPVERVLLPAAAADSTSAITPAVRAITEYDLLRLRIMERMAGGPSLAEGGAR